MAMSSFDALFDTSIVNVPVLMITSGDEADVQCFDVSLSEARTISAKEVVCGAVGSDDGMDSAYKFRTFLCQ